MKSLEDVKKLSVIEKYILMIIYVAKKIKGRLWFHKEMFLLSKAFNELAEELDFESYSFGPYSEALEEYRDMLENSGLIKKLELTEEGLRLAEELWKHEKEERKEIIKEIVEFLENLDEDELLLFILVNYPEMTDKSDIREKIMKRRKEIALKMLKEEKISISLAAKLAGLSIKELLEIVIKQGIKPFDVYGDLD
jgi:predicted HTH domain antitoxin